MEVKRTVPVKLDVPDERRDDLRTTRRQVPSLDGLTIGEADVRGRTGCTVLAIEREDAIVTDIGPDTAIQPEDVLVVVGAEAAINAFEQEFQSGIG